MASAALGTAFRHLRDLFAAGSVVGLEDGQLLARYSRSNDPAAFEALVSRHGPMVLATCRAVLRNEQDAEDAFQATFLVLAKKAHSIRGTDALGGWLHRVAYRASVQASVRERRRRRKEAEASAMAPPDASHPVQEVDFELRPILHEEIDRLPEGHRLPVVLCDLEGMTYEQAADQLRWTVPTLRCRLAKARLRLKGRLARRGVAPLAVGPLIVPKSSASASVPPALLKATVLAATGGSASAGAALLAHTILRGMLMTKIKFAGLASMAALGLASAGLIAAGAGKPEDTKPAMKPAEVATAAKDAPKPAKPGEVVEIKGLVVDPAGKPVAGATIRIGYYYFDDAPLPEVLSGPEGRFTIGVPASSRRAADTNNFRFPWLVASAPGFGPGHVESVLKPGATSPTIRLVEDGPPIEGRIIDLEGRPVAGAKVASEYVWFEPGGDLAGWLARVKDHGTRGTWDGLMELPMKVETRADADGRFRLSGFGRDRVAGLMISAPTIATRQVYVHTRDGGEVHAANAPMMTPGEAKVFHAAKFQHVAAPTKPIEGTILDTDSGRPLAGWVIHGMVYDESSHVWTEGVEAKTDAEGRYRLTGLAKATSYRLFLNPAKGRPYTKATVVAQAGTPGLDPVRFDVRLKHGVLVKGRVTDKATGLPVTGSVDAYTFADNPHLGDFPGYAGSYRAGANLDADGRFEVATPAGPGIIACRSNDRLYRGAQAGSIKAPFDARMQSFATEPEQCNIGDYHALTEVDLDPKAETATVDLQVDPGHSLEIAVVDAEGHPVGGIRASGLRDLFPGSAQPQESARIEVRSLAPGKPRRVTVTHDGRKLVGSLYLRGDEAGPLTLKLQPWGTITGRAVDDEGRPRKDIRLSTLGGIDLAHPEVEGVLPQGKDGIGLVVDGDGRFRIEGLIPGLKYGADAVRGYMGQGDVFKDVTVAPGEVKDLGDLKVAPSKQED